MNRYLVIRSLSRNTTSTNSSNLQITMPNTPIFGATKMKLIYFVMYSTIYNINSSNNILDFKVGATSYAATIPVGSYNATTFATALQTAMTSALSNSWSVTYSATSLTFTITGTSAFQLLLNSGTHAGANNNLWRVMGIASANGLTSIDTTSATSTSSTQTVNFALPLSFYVNVSVMSGKFVTSDNDDFTFYIPNDASSVGGIIEFKAYNYFDQIVDIANPSVLQNLSISFKGPNNTSVQLNGSEYEMIFELIPGQQILQVPSGINGTLSGPVPTNSGGFFDRLNLDLPRDAPPIGSGLSTSNNNTPTNSGGFFDRLNLDFLRDAPPIGSGLRTSNNNTSTNSGGFPVNKGMSPGQLPNIRNPLVPSSTRITPIGTSTNVPSSSRRIDELINGNFSSGIPPIVKLPINMP